MDKDLNTFREMTEDTNVIRWLNKDLNLTVDFRSNKVTLLIPGTTKQHVPEDRISQLPTEMLSCILSFLTFKEAGRTSTLSKIWKHVWTYVPELDFNALNTLCKVATGEKYRDRVFEERPKFVNWVNKVLESHQTIALNKFRIYCDLDNSYQADLDEWLQYAFERGVQKMEVNLSPHGPGYHPTTKFYVFPSAFVAQKSWNSLKVLILKRISISGDNLEFLLHSCKLLESLVVYSSGVLRTLKVHGPSLALRHLEICYCPLKTLIISNVNLISLKLCSPRAIILKNVPQLIHVDIPSLSFRVDVFIDRLSSCILKLEVLSLFLNPENAREYERKLPQLPALKQLVVELFLFWEESMSGLTSFFRASPSLEKFAVKMRYPFRKMLETSIEPENVVHCSAQHLRVVEIYEYRGRSIELQLVKYLLENAVSLEKIIVDPRCEFLAQGFEPWYDDPEVRSLEAEITNDGRRCAEQQLLGIIPSHVTLQIL